MAISVTGREDARAFGDVASHESGLPRRVGLVERIRRAYARERAHAQLRALDDRMLTDIGLDRPVIPSKAWWFPGP